MVSIKDISIACGVSVATVSKALNNHTDIGEETKERIHRVAKEMGYVPNFASKALKTNRTYNLGVLYQNFEEKGFAHDFFAQVLDGFKNTAESQGYDITFINNNTIAGRKMTFLEHCRYRRFDGVAIISTDFNDAEVEELVKSDVPLVTIDHTFDNKNSVISDNVKGINDLLHYIYDRGHRKIAYIHGKDSAVTKNRVASFYNTCEELGIRVPHEYVKEAAYRDTTATYRATRELLKLKEKPTCILFPDDFASIGGMNCIRLAGMRIPEDMSVAGYDGIEISKYLEPALTTVVQDKNRIGMEAANKLIHLIENPKTTTIEQIKVEGTVFEGASVKDLNRPE